MWESASLEEREVHAAIGTMLHEARMLREVVALAVLEHKQAALVEQVTFHDYVGHLRQLLQSIGRVGKDEIEALATARQIAEHISTHGACNLSMKLHIKPK